MKKTVRRLFCGAVASVVLLNSGFSVGAAGLRDIFDADYYAEKYSDLKEAFGNDEEALYQHFINYGIKEGRVMNPVIDVVKYREQYKDLQEAFGDDWDAYINHYFVYGVNEHRENGTDFDLLAYLNAYGDLKEAYGDDYVALAKHYEELGIHENRVKASKAFVQMEQAAKQNSAKNEDAKGNGSEDGKQEGGNAGGETTGGNEQGDVKQEYDVRGGNGYGSWVKHYDVNDRLIYVLNYKANGEFDYGTAYTYNEAGQLVQKSECNSDGSIRYASEKYEYDEAGNMIWNIVVNPNGIVTNKTGYTYDENGNVLTETWCFVNGSTVEEYRTVSYTYNNNVLTDKWTYSHLYGQESNIHDVYIYNGQGDCIEHYVYNGNTDELLYVYTFSYEYAEDGSKTVKFYVDGNLATVTKCNSQGKIVEQSDGKGNIYQEVKYNEDGTAVRIQYKYRGNGVVSSKLTSDEAKGKDVLEEYNYKGDVVSRQTYIGNEMVNDYDASYTATYEYAEDGSKVETRHDLDGNVRDVIKYNSAGEVIE